MTIIKDIRYAKGLFDNEAETSPWLSGVLRDMVKMPSDRILEMAELFHRLVHNLVIISIIVRKVNVSFPRAWL